MHTKGETNYIFHSTKRRRLWMMMMINFFFVFEQMEHIKRILSKTIVFFYFKRDFDNKNGIQTWKWSGFPQANIYIKPN